jgi:hypothetical protein
MKDYLEILVALKNLFNGVPSENIESYLRFLMIGSMAGWLFLLYLAIKIIRGIRLSVASFWHGYKGKQA